MRSPDFEKSTELATELLYNQNIKNRILDIRKLNYGKKKIIFDSIQNYSKVVNRPLTDFLSQDNHILKDGCTLVLSSRDYLILYNDQIRNWEHLNWTLAHEVGHIYMEHIEDGPIEEIEAHYFAAQLFMPEYSILMMQKEHGSIKSDDLIEIFGVSPEAAARRINTMRKRCFFRASAIDKEIWGIQKDRVDLYYNCNRDRYKYRNTLDIMLYMDSIYEDEFFREAYI